MSSIAVTAGCCRRCPCGQDGYAGRSCEQVTEPFCANQCTGHGDCVDGFCRCQQGYYGHDCARRARGSPAMTGCSLCGRM